MSLISWTTNRTGLNILAWFINQIKRLMDQIYGKLAHCESKTIAIWEIKTLFSCYAPLNGKPFFDSLGTQYK